MTSSISLTHLGTFYYCYICYISLNIYFSAILASYEVKLLEDVDNCHLRAQLDERNNKYYLCNIKFKWDLSLTKVWVMKRKKLELKANKMPFQVKSVLSNICNNHLQKMLNSMIK